jgi:hypothetical protein
MTRHTDFEPYKRMVFQAVLQTAILRTLAEPPDYLVPAYDGVRAAVIAARSRLLTKARGLAAEWDGKTETVSFFGMTVRYRFGEIARALEAAVPTVAPAVAVGGAATDACEF